MVAIIAIAKSIQPPENHRQSSSRSSSHHSISIHNSSVSIGGSGGVESGQGGSTTLDSPKNHHFSNAFFSKSIVFNTEIPLPQDWEQFLDLQRITPPFPLNGLSM
ncbi:Hypothetical predicted protein, partial [Olea europaea subsp. europaea]